MLSSRKQKEKLRENEIAALVKVTEAVKQLKLLKFTKKWSKIIIVVDKINYKTLVVFLAAGIG